MESIPELLRKAEEFEQNLPEQASPLQLPAGADIAGWIDHTLLKPEATSGQIERLCHEARQYQFASVCVNPAYTALAAGLLAGSEVAVCSVAGFPLGATTPKVKAAEAQACLEAGAYEIDMVLNVGALKSGAFEAVYEDVRSVVWAVREGKGLLKVILETALLTRKEKILACLICKAVGADFVKTSTGFGPGGATVEDVDLMRRVVGAAMGVKAAGGIRDYSTALAMIRAGATRLGASASVQILQEALV